MVVAQAEAAQIVARAHAEAADLSAVGGDWATVAGVPCLSIRDMDQPWATQARPLAVREPLPAAAVAEVTGWLAARKQRWTVLVRGERVPDWPDYAPYVVLGAFVLSGEIPAKPLPPGVTVRPARDPDEFLAIAGYELAPLVTARHLRQRDVRHLVARLDGRPVGTARVRVRDGIGYVSGIAVAPAYRGRGLGAAVSAAATRLAAADASLVWLHAAGEVSRIYERLGYVRVDEHVQMLSPRDG